jgi:hypothetical protein
MYNTKSIGKQAPACMGCRNAETGCGFSGTLQHWLHRGGDEPLIPRADASSFSIRNLEDGARNVAGRKSRASGHASCARILHAILRAL